MIWGQTICKKIMGEIVRLNTVCDAREAPPSIWMSQSLCPFAYSRIYVHITDQSEKLKCPYYSQKTLSLSYNMHLFFTLFAQQLPNDSLNNTCF